MDPDTLIDILIPDLDIGYTRREGWRRGPWVVLRRVEELADRVEAGEV